MLTANTLTQIIKYELSLEMSCQATIIPQNSLLYRVISIYLVLYSILLCFFPLICHLSCHSEVHLASCVVQTHGEQQRAL